jgi:hypothetical protein
MFELSQHILNNVSVVVEGDKFIFLYDENIKKKKERKICAPKQNSGNRNLTFSVKV